MRDRVLALDLRQQLRAEVRTPPRARVVAVAAMAIVLPSLGLRPPLEFLLVPPLAVPTVS